MWRNLATCVRKIQAINFKRKVVATSETENLWRIEMSLVRCLCYLVDYLIAVSEIADSVVNLPNDFLLFQKFNYLRSQ